MQPCSVLELAALLHVAQIAKIVKMSTYLLTGLFWRGNSLLELVPRYYRDANRSVFAVFVTFFHSKYGITFFPNKNSFPKISIVCVLSMHCMCVKASVHYDR